MLTKRTFNQALFPANETKTQNNTIIYFCGCNRILQNRDCFKSHVEQEHDGEFVKGSSHYLTITTSIVLPVKYWKQEEIDFQQISDIRHQDNSKIQKPIRKTENNVPSFKGKSQILNQSRKNIKVQDRKKNLAAAQNNKKNEINMNVIRNTSLRWNQFQLIPNQVNPSSGFFCGKCRQQFPNIQHFVIHCFENCQELEHPYSSYRIGIKNENEVNNIKENNQKQEVKQHRPRVLTPLELMKKSMFACLNDEEKFVCGCGDYENYRNKNQLYHHLASHGEILPQNSSHVIIRRKKFGNLKFFSSYLRKGNEGDPQIDWFCPCKPDKIMKRNELVLHIQKIHKGISPKYY